MSVFGAVGATGGRGGLGGGGATGGTGGNMYTSVPQAPAFQPLPGSGLPPPAPGVSQNTAAPNPQQMQVFNAALAGSAKAPTTDPLLAESVQNVRNRMSADTTQRAIGKAQGTTADASAGLAQSIKERGAQSGNNTQGAQAGLDERTLRLQAGQASDITLDREKAQDALALGSAGIYGAQANNTLAQQGQANQLLGQAGESAGQIAGNQLQSQGLNLQSWQAQQGAAAQQQQLQLQQQQLEQQAAQQQQNSMLDIWRTLYG